MKRAAVALIMMALLSVASASAQTVPPSPQPSPTPGGGFSCTPKGADFAHPRQVKYSDAALAGLIRSYRASEVVGLRAALNSVIDGTTDAESKRTMTDVSSTVITNRFVLLADDPGMFGGYWLQIQFRNAPEAMYRIWIYGHGETSRNGPFSIRSWDRAECSPRQQHWLEAEYGDLYQRMPGG
jgi:hypothetical protein